MRPYALQQQVKHCLGRQALRRSTGLSHPNIYSRASSSQSTPSKPVVVVSGSGKSRGDESAARILFSENQPLDLAERVSRLTAWTVTPSRRGLRREFTFPSFAAAWRFMSAVADECKARRHHPSWHNLYNKVTVEWTTHEPEGLSIKDAEMAEFCDRTAAAIGLRQTTSPAEKRS